VEPPKIFKAEAPRATNGVVWWFGSELAIEAAILHRQRGGNLVVRGTNKKANRRVAQQIEDAVGVWVFDKPHKNSAGEDALPHFHRLPNADGERIPPGHTFYEVDKSKAKRKP